MIKTDTNLSGRLDLAKLCIERGLTKDAVEVGVWRGEFSFAFLDRWPGRMYMVDPWCKLPDEEYDDVRNREYTTRDYDFVQERSRKYRDRAFLIRSKSLDAVKMFSSESLDFVYIDANHAYDHVLDDMHAWWPKVREGGILAGHDIFALPHPRVTEAVLEFAATYDVDVHIISGDYDKKGVEYNHASWYINKE